MNGIADGLFCRRYASLRKKFATNIAKYFTCDFFCAKIAKRLRYVAIIPDLEKYPRGRRGAPAKGVVRVTVARVQISLSPPIRVAFEHAALFLP